MSNVIHLDDSRLKKKKCKPARKQSFLKNAPSNNSDTRFNHAFWLFSQCSSLGKRRQRELLYEILCRYRFERRPISVGEMAEMMFSYVLKNKKYFEEATGNPWPFDFEGELTMEKMMRMTNFCVKRARKPT